MIKGSLEDHDHKEIITIGIKAYSSWIIKIWWLIQKFLKDSYVLIGSILLIK
jgi:hypothetical protein